MSGEDELLTPDDETLLARIAQVQLQHDPIPAGLTDRLSFAMSVELMNAELATIAESSLLAARALPPVTTDTCTFTASSLSLMIMLTRVDGGVRIDGWVTGGGLLVEAHSDGEVLPQTSDATGRLEWPLIPHGTVQFLIHPGQEGQRAVLTPRIEV